MNDEDRRPRPSPFAINGRDEWTGCLVLVALFVVLPFVLVLDVLYGAAGRARRWLAALIRR